jgi:hypothetical protein
MLKKPDEHIFKPNGDAPQKGIGDHRIEEKTAQNHAETTNIFGA